MAAGTILVVEIWLQRVLVKDLPHHESHHWSIYGISLCCGPFCPSAASQQSHPVSCGFGLESHLVSALYPFRGCVAGSPSHRHDLVICVSPWSDPFDSNGEDLLLAFPSNDRDTSESLDRDSVSKVLVSKHLESRVEIGPTSGLLERLRRR